MNKTIKIEISCSSMRKANVIDFFYKGDMLGKDEPLPKELPLLLAEKLSEFRTLCNEKYPWDSIDESHDEEDSLKKVKFWKWFRSYAELRKIDLETLTINFA